MVAGIPDVDAEVGVGVRPEPLADFVVHHFLDSPCGMFPTLYPTFAEISAENDANAKIFDAAVFISATVGISSPPHFELQSVNPPQVLFVVGDKNCVVFKGGRTDEDVGIFDNLPLFV